MFRTSVHGIFPTCHALKTRFELSRVKLYRNVLKEIFELSRVRVSESSNYRESSVDFKLRITYRVKNIHFLNWLDNFCRVLNFLGVINDIVEVFRGWLFRIV